ncbi:alcohol dehydrogenase-like regulatory protein ErcA [Plebeiibacterium marinum]|uniref:Iron-containing alcohol dehydrogenase n=1 Tax=Plebeiibacterium marinum TaxID=2992111 RepID=A0AAE3SLT4_9BACT|nr:alcohol dehydrogenase-like regulatory protein ErcA [Plebeiobacterium marinum]MCW3807804.1 iron-containing alcohol dehydrogenase [Plebeiobacterium marinum]
MNLRKYLVPEFVIGDNALGMVGRYALNFGAKKILIVTDDNIIKAGWYSEVREAIEASGIEYVVFKDLTPNPKDYEVEEGASLYQQEGCDIIVAVGGGSVIDCAKGIGIVSSNKQSVNLFEGVDKVRYPMPPLICIPTTAGSAADISQFAIVLNSAEKRKIAIISKSVVPDISLIDGITTTTMSNELSVASGIDAMVHAIEAYVSNASSPITDLNALKAIELITANLPRVVAEPNNIVYRNNVMLGSLLAGMAFSNASLGLVHAMAHSMGGLLDLPHGNCNAYLLDNCIEYNYDSCAPKYQDIYKVMAGSKPLKDRDIKQGLIEYVRNFRESFHVDLGSGEICLTDTDIEQLSINAYNDPCLATNPKNISKEQIGAIYERVFR